MNLLNSIKRNPLAASFLLIFVILLGFAVWLSHGASARRAEIETELGDEQRKLNSLYNTRPAPSADNARILQEDRRQLEWYYQELVRGVFVPPAAIPEALTPIDFSKRVDQTVARVRQAAGDGKVGLPENFRLGFGRYAVSLPCFQLSGEECRRVLHLMVKQLYAAEKLTMLLIDSKVEEIRMLRRVDVEPASGAGPDAMDALVVTDPKLQTQQFPFEFQFACGEEELRKILNALSRQDTFFSVQSVQLVQETVAASGSPAVGREPTPERRRLAVTVRIDYVEFPQPSAAPERSSR